MLVEISAQPVEFIFIGQISRADNLVIFGRPALIVALWHVIPVAALRVDRLHAVFAHVAVGIVHVVHVGRVIVGLGFLAFAFLRLRAGFGLSGFAPALVFAFAVLFLFLLGFIAAFIGIIGLNLAFGKIEMLEHRLRERGKGDLIVEREAERIKIFSSLFLNPVAEQVNTLSRTFRYRLPRQPFAHHQGKRGRDGNFLCGLSARNRVGAQPHLERVGEVALDPLHRPRSERLDPRGFYGIECSTCHRLVRAQSRMACGIMMLEA